MVFTESSEDDVLTGHEEEGKVGRLCSDSVDTERESVTFTEFLSPCRDVFEVHGLCGSTLNS